ncbi:MAG: hypothetical protein KDA53_02725 [Hyphomonas sp.]|nr:hypothetical protein [Hyphomonas sp.]
MRCLTVLLLCLLPCAAATAAPVTMIEAKDALASAGGEALNLAYDEGSPVITGEMEEVPFEARLSDCEGAYLACTRVALTACLPAQSLSRIEALEFANDWNMASRLSFAFARDDWFGQSACLKYTESLLGEAAFGADDIFLWRLELEDFRLAVEDSAAGLLASADLDTETP